MKNILYKIGSILLALGAWRLCLELWKKAEDVNKYSTSGAEGFWWILNSTFGTIGLVALCGFLIELAFKRR